MGLVSGGLDKQDIDNSVGLWCPTKDRESLLILHVFYSISACLTNHHQDKT